MGKSASVEGARGALLARASLTRVVVKLGVVPLVPRLQQHLRVPRHHADVQALALAGGVLAQRVQLRDHGRHVDERVVISLEHKLDVVALHRVL